MTTILSEGVKVPDVGSVNWAGDLEVNWNLLNGALANLSSNVKLDRDNIWTGEQSFTLPIVGSITGTASRAIADEDGTSIKSGYVNVAGNQTVTGDKSFTGSNTFNNILPNATNTYSLGSSSYQWGSVYAQNYYYNGTAWGLDKANAWSQNQSVANASTPKFILKDTRNDRTYSVTDKTGGVMRWECDDKDDAPLSRINTTLRQDKVVQLQFAIFNEDSTGTEFDRTIRFAVGNTGSAVYYPEQTGNVELGDSSHKWKTLNGINPGALSLPGDYVNVETTNWVLDGSGINSFSPVSNGWLGIQASDTVYNQMHYVFVGRVGGGTSFFQQNVFSPISGLWENKYRGCVFIPVIKDMNYHIRCICDSIVVTFYPCRGNV